MTSLHTIPTSLQDLRLGNTLRLHALSWIKNIFALPGIAAALAFADASEPIWKVPIALLSLCLIVSANYSINDLLDTEYDRFHRE